MTISYARRLASTTCDATNPLKNQSCGAATRAKPRASPRALGYGPVNSPEPRSGDRLHPGGFQFQTDRILVVTQGSQTRPGLSSAAAPRLRQNSRGDPGLADSPWA